MRHLPLAGWAFISVLFASTFCAGRDFLDLRSVAESSNAFAADLYGQLAQKPGNLFFSPYSISSALAMTYAGARGETAGQMAKVLHFDLPDERLHAAFGALADDLNAGGTVDGKSVYQMSVANSLWVQAGFPIKPRFVQLLQTTYHSEVRPADFNGNPDDACARINDWAAKKTNDKIKNLITPDILKDPHNVTRLALLNAIYFKGNWAEQFKKENTQSEAFHLEQQDVQAPMMHEDIECRGMENDDFQAVALPYNGYSLTMVILLPRQTNGLRGLEKQMTAQNLHTWLNGFRDYKVQLSIPKFTMNSGLELGETLSAMGMGSACSPVLRPENDAS